MLTMNTNKMVWIIGIIIIIAFVYTMPQPPKPGMVCCRVTPVVENPVSTYMWADIEDCSNFKDGNLILGARHQIVGNSYCADVKECNTCGCS